LERKFEESDIGLNIQNTIIDSAVTHAIKGKDYIDQIFNNVQYTVLQAALILTITFPLFLNPIDLSTNSFGGDDTTNSTSLLIPTDIASNEKTDALSRSFSALIGFAAVSHIGCIIGLTIMVSYVNRAITSADAFVEILATRPIFIVATILNYLADCSAMVCLMLVGFDRSRVDGSIIISLGCFAVLGLLCLFGAVFSKGSLHQDSRIFLFYKKYCDSNGELKAEYVQKICAEV